MSDDRLGVFDRIKAFFAVGGCLFAGWLLLWGPAKIHDEMREEFSDDVRVKMGIGFIVFGLVFGLTAIFASGKSARSQAIAAHFKGLLSAGVLGLFLWFVVGPRALDAHAAWRLKDGAGRTTQARVTDRHMHRFKKTTSWSYTIRYDGHSKRLRLPKHLRGSSLVGVVYLPDDPQVVLPGDSDDGFMALLGNALGKGARWAWAATAVVASFLFLWSVKRFVFGRSRPPSA